METTGVLLVARFFAIFQWPYSGGHLGFSCLAPPHHLLGISSQGKGVGLRCKGGRGLQGVSRLRVGRLGPSWKKTPYFQPLSEYGFAYGLKTETCHFSTSAFFRESLYGMGAYGTRPQLSTKAYICHHFAMKIPFTNGLKRPQMCTIPDACA